MSRATNGPATRKRHKRVLKHASGYYGTRSRLFRTAKESVAKAWKYAYTGRKLKKRTFRALWIARINAAARDNNTSYSRLMNGLSKAEVQLDRRALADLAVHDPAAFTAVAELAANAQ